MSRVPNAADMLTLAEQKAETAYGYLSVGADWLSLERAAGYPLTPEQARKRDALTGAITTAITALDAAIYGGGVDDQAPATDLRGDTK